MRGSPFLIVLTGAAAALCEFVDRVRPEHVERFRAPVAAAPRIDYGARRASIEADMDDIQAGRMRLDTSLGGMRLVPVEIEGGE